MNSKEEKTRKLRYNKSLLQNFNYQSVCDDLYEIQERCNDIKYMVEDDDIITQALDGNEDEVYEFRMAFCELASKCEDVYDNLYNLQYENYYPDTYFDEFFAGVANGAGMKWYAYSEADEDYYAVTSYEGSICAQEAQKKLMRMKKEDLIACSNRCFRILVAYLDLKYRYDYLSATMQILNDEQKGVLDMVKELDVAYSDADKDDWHCYGDAYKKFDKLLESVPERMWIE